MFLREEKKRELILLIIEDNVEEIEKILNSNNKLLQNTFNSIRFFQDYYEEQEQPLLLYAVQTNSQRILEYLLSQDFVDKTICNEEGENIYHVVCSTSGAEEELFSIIERRVPHDLILNNSIYRNYLFHDSCQYNTVFIVKRMYEIMESL